MKLLSAFFLLSAFGAVLLPCPKAEAQQAKPAAEKKKEAPSISVSAFDFRDTKGVAIITLFKDEDSWPDIPKAYKKIVRKIKGKSVWVQFKDLEPGTYAISVLHDENENNKLDMKWLPYPRPGEGVGSSNNYKGRPKWKHAKFTVGEGNKKIKIRLRYF